MSEMICPGCHKQIQIGTAAFCPFCGARLSAEPAGPVTPEKPDPEEVVQGLREIALAKDIKKKNKLMDELLAKYPDNLRVNTEKLFLTRVADLRARTLDFSVIKCHLLHYYLTPEEFSNEAKASMRHDLFHHEQLEKCLSLAPDREQFLWDYLRRLCTEFVNIFLHSSTTYNRSILGIRLDKRMDHYLAGPVCKMMNQIYHDGGLTVPQRDMLYSAMAAGLSADVGNSAYLEELLAQQGLPLPKKY